MKLRMRRWRRSLSRLFIFTGAFVKPISQQTWSTLNSLKSKDGFWQRHFEKGSSSDWSFEQIAQSGESAAVAHVASFLVHPREEVRRASQQAIESLIRVTVSEDFVELDDYCRREWSYGIDDSWKHIKPAMVETLRQSSAVMGLASFHMSGFIRAEAVAHLAEFWDGSELPFLLLRVNDWVEPIRAKATAAVLARITPDYGIHFLKHLRLVHRLRNCGRGDHDIILNAVTSLLFSPAAQSLLREALASSDRWLLREAAKLAAKSAEGASPDILQEFLHHHDPVVRLWVARSSLNHVNDDALRPLVKDLVCDGSLPVRCLALNVLAERLPAEADDLLHASLLDTHSSIRAIARYWITKQNACFDFATGYREILSKGETAKSSTAILGLAEVGASKDAELVRSFYGSRRVSVRKAVIRALSVLDATNQLTLLLSELGDGHPGVSKEAMRALLGHVNATREGVLELFRNSRHAHVRRNAFTLLRKLPAWSLTLFLFEALRDRDETFVELARQDLRVRLRSSSLTFMKPTKDEASELRSALKASAGMFSEQEMRDIEFCLKGTIE
jgi:HEAT repeat protein